MVGRHRPLRGGNTRATPRTTADSATARTAGGTTPTGCQSRQPVVPTPFEYGGQRTIRSPCYLRCTTPRNTDPLRVHYGVILRRHPARHRTSLPRHRPPPREAEWPPSPLVQERSA